MYVCPECGEAAEGAGECSRDGTLLAPTEDQLLGQTIGPWRLARLIGAGGMGRVYKAVQPSIGGRVAVKVLNRESTEDRDLIERFFAEARAVNVIRHENIVDVLDLAFLPDGRPYIVMDYLDGASLSAVIAARGRLPFGGLARLGGEVLGAIGAAHARGIVHRDLKPDNVFVTPQGHARVLDFGIAKLAPDMTQRSGRTRSGMLLGTPTYMAPEQAAGRGIDARTDLYSIGVILYEGATGRVPFDAPVLYELLRMHIEQLPQPPRELEPAIPFELEGVILRALEKDPAKRFKSAAEMAEALAAATAGLPSTEQVALVPPTRPVGAVVVTEIPKTRTPSDQRDPARVSTALDSGPRATSRPDRKDKDERGGQTTERTRVPRRWLLIAGAALAMAVGAVAVVLLNRDGGNTDLAVNDPANALSANPNPNANPNDPASAPRDPLSASPSPTSSPIVNPIPSPSLSPSPISAPGVATNPPTSSPRPAPPPSPSKSQPTATTKNAKPAPPKPEKPDTSGTGTGTGTDDAPDPTSTEGLTGQPGAVMPRYVQLDVPSPTAFDADAYYRTALKASRNFMSDAALVFFTVDNARPNGLTDLTLGGTAFYSFRSKANSDNPPARCMVHVVVTPTTVQAAEGADDDCDRPLLGAPKCTVKEIWQRAIADGAPDKGIARVQLMWLQGAKTWTFDHKDFDKNYPDDCP